MFSVSTKFSMLNEACYLAHVWDKSASCITRCAINRNGKATKLGSYKGDIRESGKKKNTTCHFNANILTMHKSGVWSWRMTDQQTLKMILHWMTGLLKPGSG